MSDVDAIKKEPLLANGTFDLIFAFGVRVGHIAGTVTKALQSYNYLLKSGGIVMCHDYTNNSLAYEAAIAKMSASDPSLKFSVHDTYEYTSDAMFQFKVLFLKKNSSIAPAG